jgi:hypothetical protein
MDAQQLMNEIAADAAAEEEEVLLFEELNHEVAELEYRGASREQVRAYVEEAGADYDRWVAWNEEMTDRMAPNL